MLRLPIGYDIFGKLVEQNFDFIDKTLFAKDVFDDIADVLLITRPRRFGKTLNLSMLHHFLVEDAYGLKTKGIFDKFKIAAVDGGKYMQHQGKYPVIFITLKDIKDDRFAHAYACLERLVKNLYAEHEYLLESPKLTDEDKLLFKEFLRCEARQADIENALLILSKHLYSYHGVKTWLLIDEYDTPLQSAYLHGYYSEMISLFRSLFGAALKTNPYVYKSVITGILRISKESIFSELNNLKVYSTLQDRYSQYFGFTEDEMDYILQNTGLNDKASEIKKWYNGYQFGKTTVYNPWSIVNCVAEQGKLQLYWVNTSGNDLIRNLLINSQLEFKAAFEDLLQDIQVKMPIDEHVTFGDLNGNQGAAWSLLLAAGYLKATTTENSLQGLVCSIAIPNLEVKVLYRRMIEQWLSGKSNIMWYNRFLEHLLNGEIDQFAEYLKSVMLQIVSVHDVAREPEAFYHGLMLGFTASLTDYEIKSNRESGRGRYDIVIIPKDDLTKNAIILELKSELEAKNLLSKAQEALIQIAKKDYVSEINARGIKNIIKIGIAFCGKDLAVKFGV